MKNELGNNKQQITGQRAREVAKMVETGAEITKSSILQAASKSGGTEKASAKLTPSNSKSKGPSY